MSTTYFSKIIVTGPSFKRLTFMSAPNIPQATFFTSNLNMKELIQFLLF